MTAWSHLPNAKHIDRVLESIKTNHERWIAVWDAVIREAIQDETWYAAREAARCAALDAAWYADRNVAWDAAWDASWNAASDSSWNAVRDTLIALIAYDHASKYLQMKPDQLRAWALLSEDPAAVLLIPAVVVRWTLNLKRIQNAQISNY